MAKNWMLEKWGLARISPSMLFPFVISLGVKSVPVPDFSWLSPFADGYRTACDSVAFTTCYNAPPWD